MEKTSLRRSGSPTKTTVSTARVTAVYSMVLSKSLDRTRGMMTGRRPIAVRARGGFLEDAGTLDLA